jgi:ABC-type cobalamin transport system permease subunit
MTTDGVGLPARPPSPAAEAHVAARQQRAKDVRSAVLIAVMLVLASVLHLFAGSHFAGVDMHFLYLSLIHI